MRTLIFLIFIFYNSSVVAQGYIWALPFNSTNMANVNRICASSFGTIYSTGATSGTTDFDPGPGSASVTATGIYSGYIVKQQTSGAFGWVIPIIGSSYALGIGLALDKAENVYACGSFEGTADFDPGPGTFMMNSQMYLNGYVCKYDSSGQLVWAKHFGETGQVYCRTVSLDLQQNIYVTGHFSYTADFDPGPGTYLLTATGNTDGFIMKLDPLGNLLWVSMLYSSNQLQCANLVYDGIGNVYVAGSFNDTVDFDPGPGAAISIANNFFHNGFIVKYDAGGNYIWSGTFGSDSTHEMCYDLAMDPAGKLVVCGKFLGTSDFDLGSGTSVLAPAGNTDAFVVKYDTSGSLLWTWHAGGPGAIAECVAMTIDPVGNIYCCGRMQDTVDFDDGPGNWLLQTGTLYTAFVVRLDSSGVLNWAGIFEGTTGTTSYAGSICMDSLGTIVYTGGSFDGTTDFDPNPPLAQLTGTSFNGDGFIQKMTCIGPPTSVSEYQRDACVQLFPNPSDGDVTLQFCETPGDPVSICIYDAQGKLVVSECLPASVSQRITVEELPPGLYAVRIVSGEISETLQLLLN